MWKKTSEPSLVSIKPNPFSVIFLIVPWAITHFRITGQKQTSGPIWASRHKDNQKHRKLPISHNVSRRSSGRRQVRDAFDVSIGGTPLRRVPRARTIQQYRRRISDKPSLCRNFGCKSPLIAARNLHRNSIRVYAVPAVFATSACMIIRVSHWFDDFPKSR